ncbi:MAG TPA: choice-of-anchor D domain-containing protein, partial [Longimicrobium sp.]
MSLPYRPRFALACAMLFALSACEPETSPSPTHTQNPPSLAVNAASLSFAAQQGADPAAQTLTISNTGEGTLNWSASENLQWLTLGASSGSLAAGTSTTVTIAVSTAGMTSGNYSGSIELTAPGASGSPRAVTVTLTLTAPPVLAVGPTSLNFTSAQGSDPAAQSLTIGNSGGGTLGWTATESIPWLVGSPGSGTLGAGQTAGMGISVSTAGLAPGTYNGVITVSAPGANNAPQAVAVTLTVTPGPAIGVSPASLSFAAQVGTNPPGQTLTIANTGGGALTWTASEPVAWLVGSPAGGTLNAGQTASLELSVNTAGLAAGTYTGIITVTAPGAPNSPQTVPVTLTVSAAPPSPVLGVSPASLSFNAQQGSNP